MTPSNRALKQQTEQKPIAKPKQASIATLLASLGLGGSLARRTLSRTSQPLTPQGCLASAEARFL